jgi:GAF domain-containing protein/anti-sigma regulatory factor (Ser/Thr protein kinase)
LTPNEPTAAKKPGKPSRRYPAALDEREAELAELRRQRTATAEILRVISQTPTDPQPVFERIVMAASRTLRCDMAVMLLREGDVYVHTAAATPEGLVPDFAPERFPIDASANFPSRALLAKTMLHLPDWSQIDLPKHERWIHETFGITSALYWPLLRDDESIGVLVFAGTRPNLFGPGEIAQAESFRDQALIAIDNARLFEETQRALERQTATAEILKVIASSPSDVQPVFEAIATTANHLLCGISTAVWRFVDGTMFLVAFTRTNPAADETLQASFPRPLAEMPPFLPVLDGRTQQVADIEAPSGVPALLRDLGRLRGFRSILFTPLMSNGAAIGMITVTRKEPGAFVPVDVQLLRTFADQAVIAVNNVGLFNETHEALEQQKAASEVLQVISRSTFDLDLVFQTLVENAVRLCGARTGMIFRRDGPIMRVAAADGATPEFVAYVQSNPIAPGRGAITGRAALEGRTVHVLDIEKDPEYTYGGLSLERYRSIVAVPLMRNGAPVGVFTLWRHHVQAFTPRQIALVETFADQAVVAIENVRLFNETQEALRQQTATADILTVIASSPNNIQPVLDKIVETACRLCNAYDAAALLREGDRLRPAAHYGPIPLTFASQEISREWAAGRAVIEGRAIHIDDFAKQVDEYPVGAALASATGSGAMLWRATLVMPLMREGEAIGVIGLRRAEPAAFSEGQIELLKTFSDQAVIAIENVRLFDEVQARTKELTEALEHQTATSEVLAAISSSPTEVQPVFDAIARSATELCGATSGGVDLFDGELIHLASHHNWSPKALEAMRQVYPAAPSRGFASARAILTRSVVHIPNISEDPEYTATPVIEIGFRSVLAVPMLREGEPIGAIALVRLEPRPFTDRQIALLQTFAEQAVIAINNVRLFDEVQAKTHDLEEALAQQTATADVLKVISRSAFDLDAVLKTLTDSARSLSGASLAAVFMRDGDVLRIRAESGFSPALIEYAQARPIRAGRETFTGRAALSGELVHIPDVLADPDYDYGEAPRFFEYRAGIGVPLLRAGGVDGVFALMRPQPGAFTPRQIEMARAFADQAVIAIENARLFNEVQAKTKDLEEALQQQTATANVLKVISRSAFDLQAVLTTLAQSARELCGASRVTLLVREGDAMRLKAESGNTPEMIAFLDAHPIRSGRETITGRMLLTGEAVHVSDVLADPEYEYGDAPRIGDYRAALSVPLMREGRVEGALTLTRPDPGPFSEREIEMVRTFADQAIIAIENARLFGEVQARTRELTASLDDLRKAQDRLIQSEKLASLGQLTAGIAHEIKNPLNFVNNFSNLSRELLDELREQLVKGRFDAHARTEVDELVATIASNLDKVAQHGGRADSIVKNMLLHAREGSGERATVNVNAIVEEALNLAYHGARAEKPGFEVTISRSLDPNVGQAELFHQEITRVLLNLISNAFYATLRRRVLEGDGYEPTVVAFTRDLGERVEIAIRDNGTGIPDEVRAKIFNPFFTTKPAGEGTGLGLSLSHDIVVKQHGGAIDVESEPGSTTFIVRLPRADPSARWKSGGIH